MNRHFSIPTILFVAVFCLAGYLPSGAGNVAGELPARPIMLTDQIEVQFETDVDVSKIRTGVGQLRSGIQTLDNALEKHRVEGAVKMFPRRNEKEAVVGAVNMSKFYIVSLPANSDIYSVVDDLKKNPFIRSVSPVWAMPVYEVVPDDPYLGSQWAMNEIGATDVWEIEKGSDNAIVAIVDVGVLYTHADLKDNIWVNPGEDIDGDEVVFDLGDINSNDDDDNGLEDDLIGYDFFTGVSGELWPGEDGSVPDNNPIDFNGHGTHCAGIASAITNNGLDVAGLAGGWGGGNGPYRGPRIMCIRVGGSYEHPDNPGMETGFVNTANCAQGIDYAARMGASVINCSWAFANSSPAMAAAALMCNDMGVVVVHAAGNDSEYSESGGYLDDLVLGTPPYEVALSVAATAAGGYLADFSNNGEYVDICAPGQSIYSTYSDHYLPTRYWLQGTSMAAPFVAGLAALIKSHMPHYTKVEIDALIKDNAVFIDDQNPGYEGYLGSGLIDTYASMANLPIAAFDAGPELIGPAPLEVNFTDLSPNNPVSWEWDFGDGGVSYQQNPVYTYEDFGFYTVALTVDEPRGITTESLRNLVMVTADTVKFDSIRIETSDVSQRVTLPVYLNNKFLNKSMTIPFKILMNGESVNHWTIDFDSVSLAGCRTEYFDYKTISPYDPNQSRYRVTLISNWTGGSEYLPPGEGLMMNLHFVIKSSVTNGTLFTFDTLTIDGTPLQLQSIYDYYYPEFVMGKIYVRDEICGDVNGDSRINILDVIYLINYKYKDGPPPESESAADVNLDDQINILDAIYILDYKYQGGPEPCNPI